MSGLLVVGAITGSDAEAMKTLAGYRAAVPDAYCKTTRIYMGCRH